MEYATNTIKEWDAAKRTVTMADGTVVEGAWTGQLMARQTNTPLDQIVSMGTEAGLISGTDTEVVEGGEGAPVISNPAAFLDMLVKRGMLAVLKG